MINRENTQIMNNQAQITMGHGDLKQAKNNRTVNKSPFFGKSCKSTKSTRVKKNLYKTF